MRDRLLVGDRGKECGKQEPRRRFSFAWPRWYAQDGDQVAALPTKHSAIRCAKIAGHLKANRETIGCRHRTGPRIYDSMCMLRKRNHVGGRSVTPVCVSLRFLVVSHGT